MAFLRANVLSTYMAHRDWDWPAKGAMSGGRALLPSGHVGQARVILVALTRAQCELLTAPTVGRARHVFTALGRRKRDAVNAQKGVVLARISALFAQLSCAAEELKAAGMPSNEAARIRQYTNMILGHWEQLRALKRYRTLQTTRTFARLIILVHPFIMGPYYCYGACFVLAETRLPFTQLTRVSRLTGFRLAVSGYGQAGPILPTAAAHASYGFALALALVTTVALSALFNIRWAIEDPFVGPLDVLDVRKDMGETIHSLQITCRGGVLFDNDGDAAAAEESGRRASMLASIVVSC